MPAHPRNMPEQEHSIKARSNELFYEEGPVASGSSRPFAEYLRETPAQPLSPVVKAMLWVLGVVVALLFFVAVWRVLHRHAGRHRAEVKESIPSDQASRPAIRVQSARGA